jgi:hypothetical protein
MGPGPIYKFLTSVGSLAKKGNLTIDDAYRFAQQEFGQVSDILKLQINKIFKQVDAPKITLPKKDEVFDTTVTKLPYDESGRPFNPRDPLKKYGDDPEDFATGGRVGFADGSFDPKKLIKKIPKVGKVAAGVESLIKTINKKFGKGTIKTADEIDRPQSAKDKEIFEKFEARNPSPSRQLTDDEIDELAAEVGELDAYDFDGTVGSANRIRKEAKDYQDEMYQQYKMGKLDPEPGDKSPARKRFLQQKFDEMESSGDPKLMTRDEIEELTFFDMGTEMDKMIPSKPKSIIPEDELAQVKKDFDTEILGKDIEKKILDEVDEAYGVTPEMKKQLDEMGGSKLMERFELKQKYPGIDEDLLTAIIDDPDPNNKAQVLSTFDQLMQLQKMGKTPEEAVEIVKQTMFKGRRDNAQGGFQQGLPYLMGL